MPPLRLLPLLTALGLGAVPLAAQAPAGAPPLPGPPAYEPMNPAVRSRTGLYFQPWQPRPAAGRRATRLSVDYASSIEANAVAAERGPRALIDAELLRLSAGVTHELGGDAFALADVSLDGAYAGFLDGFLDWYHGLLGITMPERDDRPSNAFAYEVVTPDGGRVARRPSALHLGDVRLGLGKRHGSRAQSVVSVTVPTATGPGGYGRGVLTVNVLETLRLPVAKTLVLEAAAGAGYSPREGELADYQRTVMYSAATGLRWRPWGRQTVFATLFYGSPAYEGTRLPALDRRELSLDFGWSLITKDGREWRLGMTEDMEPSGPGIDLVFRMGTTF
jgi:hypothetical protein